MTKKDRRMTRENLVHNRDHSRHSTMQALRPFVLSILTSTVSTGVTLAGIGQFQFGLITALSGCGGCLLLALTAKIFDSIDVCDESRRAERQSGLNNSAQRVGH